MKHGGTYFIQFHFLFHGKTSQCLRKIQLCLFSDGKSTDSSGDDDSDDDDNGNQAQVTNVHFMHPQRGEIRMQLT